MAFGESLWDGVDNYSIEKVNPNTFDYYDPATNNEKVKKRKSHSCDEYIRSKI